MSTQPIFPQALDGVMGEANQLIEDLESETADTSEPLFRNEAGDSCSALRDNYIVRWAESHLYNTSSKSHGGLLTTYICLCVFFLTGIVHLVSCSQLSVFNSDVKNGLAFDIRVSTWLVIAAQTGALVGGILTKEIVASVSLNQRVPTMVGCVLWMTIWQGIAPFVPDVGRYVVYAMANLFSMLLTSVITTYEEGRVNTYLYQYAAHLALVVSTPLALWCGQQLASVFGLAAPFVLGTLAMPFMLLACYLFWLMPPPTKEEVRKHSARDASTKCSSRFYRFFHLELVVCGIVAAIDTALQTVVLMLGTTFVADYSTTLSPTAAYYLLLAPAAWAAVGVSNLLYACFVKSGPLAEIKWQIRDFFLAEVIRLTASILFLFGEVDGLIWLVCLYFSTGHNTSKSMVNKLIGHVDAGCSVHYYGYVVDGLSCFLVAVFLTSFELAGVAFDVAPLSLVMLGIITGGIGALLLLGFIIGGIRFDVAGFHETQSLNPTGQRGYDSLDCHR